VANRAKRGVSSVQFAVFGKSPASDPPKYRSTEAPNSVANSLKFVFIALALCSLAPSPNMREALPAEKRTKVTDFVRLLLDRSSSAYELNPSELGSASSRLHAKAQNAQRKGHAKKFDGDLTPLDAGRGEAGEEVDHKVPATGRKSASAGPRMSGRHFDENG
jgi:hypothetical protein